MDRPQGWFSLWKTFLRTETAGKVSGLCVRAISSDRELTRQRKLFCPFPSWGKWSWVETSLFSWSERELWHMQVRRTLTSITFSRLMLQQMASNCLRVKHQRNIQRRKAIFVEPSSKEEDKTIWVEFRKLPHLQKFHMNMFQNHMWSHVFHDHFFNRGFDSRQGFSNFFLSLNKNLNNN